MNTSPHAQKTFMAFVLLPIMAACTAVAPPASPAVTVTSPPPTATPLPTLTPPQIAPVGTPVRFTPPPPSPSPQRLWAETLPDPNTAQWVPVVQDLNQPTAVVSVPGLPHALLLLERQGIAWFWLEGERHEFLDLRDRVGARATEQGLLGAAFHPQFPQKPWIFVNYTDKKGDTVVARFTVDVTSWTADPNSEFRLLHVDQPYGNHNGGHLLFGPDGYLYIGLGDGGAAGDPHDFAQNPQTLLGKMLRIDVDHGEPYAFPPDNPFVQGGGLPEIWALGLRNPWRYDFDPLTGDLYIADVGQNKWEEINVLRAPWPVGANFGWAFYEGNHPFKGRPPAEVPFVFPVAEYGHDQGCSVTGGVVYRGHALGAAWQGVYLYGDFCSGLIWGLLYQGGTHWVHGLLYRTDFTISTFGRDAQGEVYVADYATGTIYRLTPR